MTGSPSPELFAQSAYQIEEEVAKVMVGQKGVIRQVLISILAGGHVLLEGVPGLGKTMLIRTLAQVLDLKYSRIQFTPDLMPADIVGTQILSDEDGRREFRFHAGPIFAHLVLADEINRATPKTQSALLEAMQEGSVTVADVTHTLEEPFFVMATQNPLEMEGTYPLPEAQLDRFLFKINVSYPSQTELQEILTRTTADQPATVHTVLDGSEIIAMRSVARQVLIASHLVEYVARLVEATHPQNPDATPLARTYIRYGSSPRGGQALILGAKVNALLEGRFNVAFEDIHAVALPSLRHRLLLNFEGLAGGIEPDQVILQLVEKVPH